MDRSSAELVRDAFDESDDAKIDILENSLDSDGKTIVNREPNR
jgi:hypothetical protein